MQQTKGKYPKIRRWIARGLGLLLVLTMGTVPLAASAGAEGRLAVPFAAESAEYAAAEAFANVLEREIQAGTETNGAEAVNAMLAEPETLLMATQQEALMLSLEGYTSADCREAMRPICRVGVEPLVLVMNREFAEALDIRDWGGFKDYTADHEYELMIARFVDAGIVDYACYLIENAMPVLSEICFDPNEAMDALESETIHVVVLPASGMTEETVALCTLGSARPESLPNLPCAGELGLPVCEGITMGIYGSAEGTAEAAAGIAEAVHGAMAEEETAAGLADALAAAGFAPAWIGGEAFAEETAAAFAEYAAYMTAEGLFFYEQ